MISVTRRISGFELARCRVTGPAGGNAGLLACQAERNSAVSPPLGPTSRFRPGAGTRCAPRASPGGRLTGAAAIRSGPSALRSAGSKASATGAAARPNFHSPSTGGESRRYWKVATCGTFVPTALGKLAGDLRSPGQAEARPTAAARPRPGTPAPTFRSLPIESRWNWSAAYCTADGPSRPPARRLPAPNPLAPARTTSFPLLS
jgi:hypothetical protein